MFKTESGQDHLSSNLLLYIKRFLFSGKFFVANALIMDLGFQMLVNPFLFSVGNVATAGAELVVRGLCFLCLRKTRVLLGTLTLDVVAIVVVLPDLLDEGDDLRSGSGECVELAVSVGKVIGDLEVDAVGDLTLNQFKYF